MEDIFCNFTTKTNQIYVTHKKKLKITKLHICYTSNLSAPLRITHKLLFQLLFISHFYFSSNP